MVENNGYALHVRGAALVETVLIAAVLLIGLTAAMAVIITSFSQRAEVSVGSVVDVVPCVEGDPRSLGSKYPDGCK